MKEAANKNAINNYKSSPYEVALFDVADSTNLLAKSICKAQNKSDFVIVAREQTRGRGRFDRRFCSPRDCGAYFSLAITPKENEFLYLTPLCAVAVADAICRVCKKDAKIKWVNDVYVDGKKCCGILCEAISEGNEIKRVILGIGIDVYECAEGFDEQTAQIATSVGNEIDDCINKLIATVLDNIYELRENFDAKSLCAEYRSRSFLIGRKVTVSSVGRQDESALVKDIDDLCRLVVEYADGTRESLSSGEVRICV